MCVDTMEDKIDKLSEKVNIDTLSTEVLEYFNSYLTSWKIADDSYDCSEIADDFFEELQRGKIIKIYSNEVVNFSILELGKKVLYQNHYVFVYEDLVYDPRFYNKPLYLEDYMELIRELNTNEILYDTDRDSI